MNQSEKNEPWIGLYYVSKSPESGAAIRFDDEKSAREWLAGIEWFGGIRSDSIIAVHLRRAVACIKACAGVPTEQLESDYAQGANVRQHRDSLKRERDELRAALFELVKRCDGPEGVRADGSNIQTILAHAILHKTEAIENLSAR